MTAGPTRDADQFDVFVSYARDDDRDGWITGFLDELIEAHRRFAGGRELVPFRDREQIRGLDDWQHRLHDALAASRLFLAFVSPNYFASAWCRAEWRIWMDVEIAKHILSDGVAPIYILEVPGLLESCDEQQVAAEIASLCDLPAPHDTFLTEAAPLVQQVRRRQINAVQPFYAGGIAALRQNDLRQVLDQLARDIDAKAAHVRRAASSESWRVPAYNPHFSGRLAKLDELRERLQDRDTGVVTVLHGLGGVGKSELAFTYARAFAGVYPGGRFLVRCDGRPDLRIAMLDLSERFTDQVSDEQRMTPESHCAAILECLRRLLVEKGRILLVLDNVTEPGLLQAQHLDLLTSFGSQLHVLATTRLPAGTGGSVNWVALGELWPDEGMALLEKHRGFADDGERQAAREIVRRLGGFALALELVGSFLATHDSATYLAVSDGLGLDDLDLFAEDGDVELRRHNHERRVQAVLGPTLADLEAPERRAIEYAAVLAPNQVALPWLRELVVAKFPDLAAPGRLGDPWVALCRRLERLGLLHRADGQGHQSRIMRIHRLVQDVIRQEATPEVWSQRQAAVESLFARRLDALEAVTRWEAHRWEIEPLDALVRAWADAGVEGLALIMYRIGAFWNTVAEWGLAEQLVRRGLAIAESGHGPDNVDVADGLNNLAELLRATNRLGDAEPLYRRALRIHETSYRVDHPEVAVMNNLALLLCATNRFEKAESLYRRALTIAEGSFDLKDPRRATVLSNLAELLCATNRLEDAEPLYRRALAINKASYGLDHPEVATDLNNLAALLRATNRLEQAERFYRRALRILRTSYDPSHPSVAVGLSNLAELLCATNRLDRAEPLYRRALAIDEASHSPDHPTVAVRLNNLAGLLHDTGRLAEAEPLLRRVVRILHCFKLQNGHQHPNFESAVNNYGDLLTGLGHTREETIEKIKTAMTDVEPEEQG